MAANILFCPKYDKFLKEMISEKDNAKTEEEKFKILTDFASKFTLLPVQLLQFARLHKAKFNADSCIALYSVYYSDKNAKHIEWLNKYSVVCKLSDYDCKDRFQLADEGLTFPHIGLENLYERRLYYSVTPLSKEIDKKYLASKTLYNKIKECENDIDEWWKCIKEIENKEVIVANFELKLGQNSNWKNKKLWKYYFDFLRENNMKEILEVLQRYTRLFICDKQAVAFYRNELDKFSSWNVPTTKYWIDTIKYEMEFGRIEFAYRILERALKAVIGKPYTFEVKNKNDLYEKLKEFEAEMLEIEQLRNSVDVSSTQFEATAKPTVYYQNPKRQYFSFHQSFIQNLLKNADGTILRKLYSSCKFLYSVKKAPLCYRLYISNKRTKYCQESLYLNAEDLNFDGLKNLHVYGMLNVENVKNPTFVSQILPNLKLGTLGYIIIRKQNLTNSEFQMLLSKWIIQIFLSEVEIKSNEQNIKVKEFIDIVNTYSSSNLQCVKYFTDQLFICRIQDNAEWAKPWLPFPPTADLEEIYIENQSISIFDLRRFINFKAIKNITLKNVTVKDENGNEKDKQQLEEFIKEAVNPKNSVHIEIV